MAARVRAGRHRLRSLVDPPSGPARLRPVAVPGARGTAGRADSNGPRSPPSSASSPHCRDEDRLPARVAVRRPDVGAPGRGVRRSRDVGADALRARLELRRLGAGSAPNGARPVRRGRRVDGRLHRVRDRAPRTGAPRGARARRLARGRRPARARAAPPGMDPDRAGATEARASGRRRRRTSSLPGRRTKWSRRRTGSPSSSSRTTWSARSRRSATGPTRPRR